MSPCAFCGGKGEFLCDALVEPTREQMIERHKAGGHVNRWKPTCDKPFCRACRTQVGAMIVCSRGRGGASSARDSIDHCPEHAPPKPAPCTHALVVDEPGPRDPQLPRMRSCLLCGHAYDRADYLRRLERDIRARYRLPSSPWAGGEWDEAMR